MELTSNRPSAESEARAYCLKIGADPDDVVFGWSSSRYGKGVRVMQPRWQWYLGVSEAALRKPI